MAECRYKDLVKQTSILYVVHFPRVLQEVKCLLLGCPAVAHSMGRLQEHFMYRHLRSKVAVVQEGLEPLPQCDLYGMHMPEGRPIKRQRTERCKKNTQMGWQRRDVVILDRCLEETFSLTGEEDMECIEGVKVFK